MAVLVSAQDLLPVSIPQTATPQDKNILNHLDASITAGSTGLGFDFAMPVGEYIQIRTGAAFFPHIKLKMTYGLEMTGDNSVTEGTTSFEKAARVLKETTGREVSPEVSMWAVPQYNNFKLLIDVFPFRDHRWHVTAGFYLGNRNFATAYNRTEDMPNLLSVNLYNHLVDKLKEGGDVFTWEGEAVSIPDQLKQAALRNGYIGVPFGILKNDVVKDGQVVYHKGETYYVMPGKDNMIHTEGYINKFKPYIGFGYGGHLFKGSDTMISFDAGVMFWGGSPRLVTHDGVDLVHDLPKIRGSVGRTVDFVKTFTVFPVINLRLTQRIF
ncbi:MAG: hypothetical protein J5770_01145 [Bacteroidaceae bacterium]|nr:hypothetical protein [Bacteroidaceae bacterium]